MKIRIKHIRRDNRLNFAVQTKSFIFWKTFNVYSTIGEAENAVKSIKKIESINNNNDNKTLVYNGWLARNVYDFGPAHDINFFESYPTKKCDGSKVYWKNGYDGSTMPKMEIKQKSIFGKECLEPMKVRITIEQIED